MNPKQEAWVNVLTSCSLVGLTAYSVSNATKVPQETSIIAGVIAFLGTLKGHFGESPSDAPVTPAPAPSTKTTPTST